MRLEGWEGRLAAYIEAAKDKPFSWGSHDCALWCAGWVKECTGESFIPDWASYATEEEAKALLREHGFLEPAGMADSILDTNPVMLAQRGDIVLRQDRVLGICNGRISHFIGPAGLLSESTISCIRAWKVS